MTDNERIKKELGEDVFRTDKFIYPEESNNYEVYINTGIRPLWHSHNPGGIPPGIIIRRKKDE